MNNYEWKKRWNGHTNILVKVLTGQEMYNWLYAHDENIKNINGDKFDGIIPMEILSQKCL